jgi:hypothetical protein
MTRRLPPLALSAGVSVLATTRPHPGFVHCRPFRWPAGLNAGLLYAEPGYALRAPAGPARTQARPAAPAGGPQAGQPGGIRQQLGDAAGARNGDDGPDPAAGQRQPLPRPICCGTARNATHNPYFPPFLNLVVCRPERGLSGRVRSAAKTVTAATTGTGSTLTATGLGPSLIGGR